MPRRIAIIAAVAAALFGLPEEGEARRSDRHLRFASAPVTVTSPLLTQSLRAGETVLLAWEALPELGRHEGLEEWEAFLSLDDGGRYPVRVTPHLDIDQRSFAVTLPQFAAKRARLLLRFGDELDEFEYELPGEFEIRTAGQLNPEPVALARGHGEVARLADPHDPGVAIWVEGNRRGLATQTVAAAHRGDEMDAVAPPVWLVLGAATAAPESPHLTAAAPSTHPFTGLFASPDPALDSVPRRAAIDPRRRTCRQNE